MAILPLNSSAQGEGTYIKQSDIIIIRSTQRLATHVGFVRAAGTLPVGRATTCLCWGVQGTFVSGSCSPCHCENPGALLAVLQTDFSLTDIREWINTSWTTVYLRKQTFWLAYTGIWPDQRGFFSVTASSIIRKWTRLFWTVYLSEKMAPFEAKYLPSVVHGRTHCMKKLFLFS